MNPFNEVDRVLHAETDGRETNSKNDELDILSNGVKIRSDGGEVNNDGSEYIYLFMAESPFQYSRAR